MTPYRMIHVVATCAVALFLLLTVISCASTRLRVNRASAPYSQNENGGENAMETVDFPPPTANGHGPTGNGHGSRPPTANGHGDPPPPPPRPAHAVRSAHGSTSLPAPPTTDTAADEGSGDPAEGPAPVEDKPIQGFGAFTKPGDLEVESWTTLEFHAGQNRAALREASEERELTTARRIWMAPIMRVTLLPDPNFEIKPQSSDIQEIQDTGSGLAGSWQWKVKPLKGGNYTLFARVEVIERGPDGQLIKGSDGQLKSHAYPPKRVDVHVRVGTWRGFLNALENAASLGDLLGTLFRSWEKTLVALTALIAAAAGLWAGIRKLKKE